MQLPRPGEHVSSGVLVPADRAEDVLAPIAVDVADGIAVAAAALTQHDPFGGGFALGRLGELPSHQRVFLDPAVDDDLGHAVAVQVGQVEGLVFAAGRDEDVALPFPPLFEPLGARVLVPAKFRLGPAAAQHVDPAVAIHVPDVVAVVRVEFIVAEAQRDLRDVTERARHETRGGEPVRAGDDVGTAVAVGVGNCAALVRAYHQAAIRETQPRRLPRKTSRRRREARRKAAVAQPTIPRYE